MSKARGVRTKSKEIYDSEGVLQNVEVEKIFNVPVTSETFTMMFNTYMGPLFGIKHLSDRKIVDKFVQLADFNTGVVVLSTKLKDEVCAELGINKPNFSKNIKRLKDLKIISGDKGTYLINPQLFWKGDRKEREKILSEEGMRVIIEFRKED